MRVLTRFFSSRDRLGPRPFVHAVLWLYLAAFASQLLFTGPVVARAHVLPYALAQAVLIWCWLALHLKRARDAGSRRAIAIGIAAIYTAALVVLLVLAFELLNPGYPEAADRALREQPLTQLYLYLVVVLLFRLMFTADVDLIAVGLKLLVLFAIAPVFLAIGYSVWLARQPSLPEFVDTGKPS